MWKIIATSALLLADGARINRANSQDEVLAEAGQCPKTVAETPNEESLQEYFDEQRVKLGLLDQSDIDTPTEESPDTCTKRDVCLLMRQLDMDFYQRARAGTLTDMDFDTPPELAWVQGTYNCKSAEKHRGKRFQTVTDQQTCKDAAVNKKLVGKGDSVTEKHFPEYPAGCIVVTDNNKKRSRLYININENSTADAGRRTGGTGTYRHETDVHVQQLCEQDRSLSESAAAYYSPYKLKQSMVERPQMSTSCSFGMMAYLHKLRETKSSCANILGYDTAKDPSIRSAADALKMAEIARGDGNDELANELEAYVRDVKSKFVLIDTIANNWCPGVWKAAMASGDSGTCAVPRMPTWTEEVQKAQLAKKGQSKKVGRSKRSRKGGRMATVKGGPAKAGNADRLSSLDDMLSEFQQEDDESIGEMFKEAAVPGTSSGGKPAKIALSDDVCAGLEDETLASILGTKPDAPPDFFRDALK